MTTPADGTVRVRRLPVVDEYVEDGESAVFVRESVVTLSHLPTALLAVVGEEWTGLADLEEELLTRFGPPEEGSAAEAVRAVVATLVDHGILESEPAS